MSSQAVLEQYNTACEKVYRQASNETATNATESCAACHRTYGDISYAEKNAPEPAAVLTPADKEALQAALLAAEDGDDTALKAWVSTFAGAGHTELIVVEDTTDSHKGRQRSNLGSPLYIAAVLNMPDAVNVLLKLGDDPNYSHPEHSGSPVLHAAELGYDEVLGHLLTATGYDFAAAPLTVDRKNFLGQGMPQYEEGGLSPLALAARNSRLSTVKLLLELPGARSAWLHRTDSFGRDLVEATCERMALTTREAVKEELKQIVGLLCAASGRDGEAALRELVPTTAVATLNERRRMRELRARCLVAERAKEAEAREKGLAEIAKHYVPTHPQLYDATMPLELTPSPSSAVSEPIPGVLAFPLLSEGCCKTFWDELHAYERAAAECASLPLHVRHDGNLGKLEEIGFANALHAIETAIAPILAERLPDLGNGDGFEVYHAFVTRNFVGRDSNATFKMHCDKSALTINICLHMSDDAKGSTVGFYNLSEQDEPNSVPEDPKHRVYTHVHTVGAAVVHDGCQWHKTDPILQGTRGSLICWARRRSDGERPTVGQHVRLRPTARVTTGVLAGGKVGVLKADDGVSRQPFEVASLEEGVKETSWYHTTDLEVAPSASVEKNSVYDVD